MAPPTEGDDRSAETGVDDGDSGAGTAPGPVTAPSLAGRPTPAAVDPLTRSTSTRRQIERLNEQERRLSFAAAAASVVIGVVIYLVETNDRSFRVTKGVLTPQTTLVIGIVFGVLLLAATLFGRRAPMGFMALFAFLFFGTRYLAGLPFLALAVWLLYRSFKFQKEASARLRTAKEESGRPSPSSRSSAGSTSTKPPTEGFGDEGPGPRRRDRAGRRPTSASPPNGQRRRRPSPAAGNGRPPGHPTEAVPD